MCQVRKKFSLCIVIVKSHNRTIMALVLYAIFVVAKLTVDVLCCSGCLF